MQRVKQISPSAVVFQTMTVTTCFGNVSPGHLLCIKRVVEGQIIISFYVKMVIFGSELAADVFLQLFAQRWFLPLP